MLSFICEKNNNRPKYLSFSNYNKKALKKRVYRKYVSYYSHNSFKKKLKLTKKSLMVKIFKILLVHNMDCPRQPYNTLL